MPKIQYCVICSLISTPGTVRAVGPFKKQQSAVDWAYAMRHQNQLWNYTPEILQKPTNV